jgi:hypothetical protein
MALRLTASGAWFLGADGESGVLRESDSFAVDASLFDLPRINAAPVAAPVRPTPPKISPSDRAITAAGLSDRAARVFRRLVITAAIEADLAPISDGSLTA